nr:retrovirus-related Pol polyprotein from transposon TNT 1-94 [Tanacetum cinerariifolium]
GNSQHVLKDKGVIDSGCSRHMIGNMSYLSEFEELNGGYVAFGVLTQSKSIFITAVRPVSAVMPKIKNSVLFTDIECLVLSPDIIMPDESQVLLRVPRENNMYNVNLNSIVPSEDLTCLFAKATVDESYLWHRRLGHINFKTINKLVKGILVRGLPIKVFENNNTCVSCKKGKQHRASCKTKPVSSVDHPLYRLHMDLFRPTFVKILNKKNYCLVVTDDYSRFTWVFFLATKDETSPILKTFITGLENQLSLKAEAVNTAFYVHNRVVVTKPHNKTPYELLRRRTPSIGFMRPFGCLVTILNTLDSLGKFKGKVDEGFLVGYSVSSKAFRVFNSRTRIVQETLHVNFLKNKPNVASSGPTWLFDIDSLTRTTNYQPVTLGNQTHPSAELEDCSDDSIKEVNATGSIVPTIRQISPNNIHIFSAAGPSNDITYSDDDNDVGVEADFNNLETSITVSPIPTTRVYKDYHVSQIIGDLSSTTQIRSMTRMVKDQVDLPHGKRAIGTKWVYKNKNDERGIVIRNKARLVAQGHTQEEEIDYKEVFAPIARIEAIRLFLAYASFIGFMVYQMDVKSGFLYRTIEEEVYVCQPLGFEDPEYHDKVAKALYGLLQAPRAWYETLANYLLENGFQRGKIDQTLFIKKQK